MSLTALAHCTFPGTPAMDEYKELIAIVKPKFFMPIWGPYRSKKRHIDLAIEEGMPKNCINAENGDVVLNQQRQN
jgi:ribonuclease J